MVSYTPQFKHKIIKKLHLTAQKGDRCCMYTHVTSSAASRDSADSYTYLFWVAH